MGPRQTGETIGWKQLQRRDMEGERDKTGWGEHTWTDMSDCGNTRRGTCGHRRETQNNDPTKTYTEGEGAIDTETQTQTTRQILTGDTTTKAQKGPNRPEMTNNSVTWKGLNSILKDRKLNHNISGITKTQ